MNRNVTIVIIILVFVVIAGYLVWLRSKYESPVSPEPVQVEQASPEPVASLEPAATASATPSATPKGKEATGSVKEKVVSPSPAVR